MDFSSENMEDRRNWNNIFKGGKGWEGRGEKGGEGREEPGIPVSNENTPSGAKENQRHPKVRKTERTC